jgi:DNA-binding NarL/FixJ family response regulator
MTIRVVIVDDQPLIRAALRTVFETAGLIVSDEAATGDEAIAAVRRHRPDVVVMDVRMPGRDGLSATAQLVDEIPDLRVLVLTTFDLDEYLYGALRAGAAGFLLKNTAPEDLTQAVRRVAAGDSVLDPAVTGRIMTRFGRRGTSANPLASPATSTAAALDTLTEREKDVLALMTRGLANAEIAATLRVGEATAKTHVSRVLTKLSVRDRVQAVIYAYESGFAPTNRAAPG